MGLMKLNSVLQRTHHFGEGEAYRMEKKLYKLHNRWSLQSRIHIHLPSGLMLVRTPKICRNEEKCKQHGSMEGKHLFPAGKSSCFEN